MPGGTNGPPIYTGAPYQHKSSTLLALRNRLMIRLNFSAQLLAPPPGMTELLNDFLYDAQVDLYRRPGHPDRIKRWWSIPIIAGERHYDVPSITTNFRTDLAFTADAGGDFVQRAAGDFQAEGFKAGQIITIAGGANDGTKMTIAAVATDQLTFVEQSVLTTAAAGPSVAVSTVNYISLYEKKIDHLMLQQDTQWWEMKEGIDPMRYNQTSASIPQCYEWTDTLEIWPAPDENYTVWIYGVFGLLPFQADTDVTTIDPDMVFNLALALAKAHYGQQDAQVYFRKAEVALNQVVKEGHGNQRYIPDPRPQGRNIPRPQQV